MGFLRNQRVPSILTPEEFHKFYLIDNNALKQQLKKVRHIAPNSKYSVAQEGKISPPKEKNWYLKATTPIRNQGQCGSCWAFSCVEQVESDWFLSGKSGKSKPVGLSTQQVIDCDELSAYGCGGTYAGGGSGYDFIKKNGGLASEVAYKYTSGKTGKTGTCKQNIPNSGGAIKNYSYAIKPCELPWDNCDNQNENAVVECCLWFREHNNFQAASCEDRRPRQRSRIV